MRNGFEHYYALDDSDLEDLAKEAVIAFDASFLLDLYRYSSETTTQMFLVLNGLAEQAWVPHQAATEFHKNRVSVVGQLKSKHNSLLDKVRADGEALLKTIEADCAKHPHLDATSIKTPLVEALEKVQLGISAVEGKNQSVTNRIADDPVWKRLTEIFANKVGPAYSTEDQLKCEQAAKKRYENRIPPGFKDTKKDYAYGDYIIWRQLIDYCKTHGRPAILVTSDVKEDWWLIHSGAKLGPLPQLRKEFAEETGQRFHLYETRHFIEVFAPRFKVQPKKAVEEIRRVQRETAHALVSHRKLWEVQMRAQEAHQAIQELNSLRNAARLAKRRRSLAMQIEERLLQNGVANQDVLDATSQEASREGALRFESLIADSNLNRELSFHDFASAEMRRKEQEDETRRQRLEEATVRQQESEVRSWEQYELDRMYAAELERMQNEERWKRLVNRGPADLPSEGGDD